MPDAKTRGVQQQIREADMAALSNLRDQLPRTHPERPGIIRAIEVLRYEPMPEPVADQKLPLIGHDRAVVNALTTALHNAARGHADYGPVNENSRGATFEVRLQHGQVARVTIELDRIERREAR